MPRIYRGLNVWDGDWIFHRHCLRWVSDGIVGMDSFLIAVSLFATGKINDCYIHVLYHMYNGSSLMCLT